MIPRETDIGAKQESINGDDEAKTSSKASSSSTTTSSWSRLKDPRIVRVSRALGGKDRHSKVCTVRGLRDRRVRLSVPTAIQLYDLQERLGLNQPSKVVDWLLNAAKQEIDGLPPLQIPQGLTFTQMLNSNHFLPPQSDKQGLIKRDDDQSWTRSTDEFGQGNYVSTNNFVSRQPYNSFGRWDPSNLSLSHTPISLGLTAESHHQHQDFVYQSGMITQPYFNPTNAVFDNKHPSFHSSDLSTSSLTAPVRPFNFNMTTADLLPSQNVVHDQTKRDQLHSS